MVKASKISITWWASFWFFISAVLVSDDQLFVYNKGFAFRSVIFTMTPLVLLALMRFNFKRLSDGVISFGFLWISINLIVSLYFNYGIRNLGYSIFALILMLWILAIVNMPRSITDCLWILKLYLYSVVILSLFGIFQTVSGYLLGQSFLAEQIWYGRLARANGLCYEPSYFAAYLVPGWCIFSWLFYVSDKLYSRAFILFGLSSVSLAFVSTTSRSGFLVLLSVLLYIFTHGVFSVLRGNLSRVLPLVFFSLIFFLGVGLILYIADFDYISLLQGTGLGDTASHSYDDRMNGTYYLFEVFTKNIFMGTGLGALPLEVGALFGYTELGFEDAKVFDNGAVAVGILAGTGILGALIFSIWFCAIVRKALYVIRNGGPFKNIAIALLIAFGAQFAVLQMNQNILRTYVWFYWGVCIMFICFTADEIGRGVSSQAANNDIRSGR
jgi:hypothetical protein